MSGGAGKVKLRLLPSGREEYVQSGSTFLAALRGAQVYVPSGCGGRGVCGRCRIRFVNDAPTPAPEDWQLLSSRELAEGWRLACAHEVARDASIALPIDQEGTQEKVQSDKRGAQAVFPAARRFSLCLPPPVAERAALSQLEEAVGRRLDTLPSLLSPLSTERGDAAFCVTTVGRRLVGLEPGGCGQGPYGLAVDVGTTTVAAYLVDLATGTQLGARAGENRQGAYGADVLSRISHVQAHGAAGLSALREAVQVSVNELVDQLAAEAGLLPGELVHVAVVGNPTMLHVFAGADPICLGHAPFAPLWARWLNVEAQELGLTVNPRATVELLPLVSGYVGADVVAGVLANGLHRAREPVLYLDLGTNGEIVLAAHGRLVSCSAAAGPAFEAVGVACGMPALPGAVSEVRVGEEGVTWRTVGGGEPRGLCGTGLTDAVAELLRVGVVDRRGKMLLPQGPLARRVQGEGNDRRFFLARGEKHVFVAQGDVRKLQLAKAALRSGVDALLAHMGLKPDEISRLCLAGAFGASMRPESLVRIGLLPGSLRHSVELVGNAAGEGAKAVLVDRTLAREARRLGRRMEYVELATIPEFGRKYVERMWFPDQSEEVRV